MSLNSINKCLTNNTLWVLFSFAVMASYLSPLVVNNGVFYVPYFDNLDSNIVWYKILAESGLIFADNNAIIPNMMNGLPRASYPSEFDMFVWLYYFFTPQTAYVINEILIHIVAFLSMYTFLKKYIVKEKKYYHDIPIFVGALYFALIPYWSGTGLTIAILPLVTYSLLNIKNNIASKFDWILIILLPLYSSFIFMYMYYIIMAGIYMILDAIKNHKLNRPFFFALILMGTGFLLSEYRLILAMFSDSEFISHRTEFDIFFDQDLLSAYRNSLVFFLDGHLSHISGLQSFYIIPTIITSMFLTLIQRKLNIKESFIIYILILISFIINFWSISLKHIYTLPIIFFLSIYLLFFKKKYKIFVLLIVFNIFLSFYVGFVDYEGFRSLTDIFPILKELNVSRLAFIQPFIVTILFVQSIIIFTQKLRFSLIYVTLILLFQIYISFDRSFYQNNARDEYASFKQYYTPKVFNQVKKEIKLPLNTITVVSYGIEPAVPLYNGFHTIDGYIPNYPLSYKHKFRKVIKPYLDKNTYESKQGKSLYDKWGSKVYILSTISTLRFYDKNILIKNPVFSTRALCELNTNYIISAYRFDNPMMKNLNLVNTFIGEKNSWDIYLYKINCSD